MAVDIHGEVYAVARYADVRTKEVKAKLGDPAELDVVETVKLKLAERMTAKLKAFIDERQRGFSRDAAGRRQQKAEMVQRHRRERRQLRAKQDTRRVHETAARRERLNKGLLRGAMDWFTGRAKRIRKQNETATFLAYRRDVREKDDLILRQLDERRALQTHIRGERHRHTLGLLQLHRDVAAFMNRVPTPSQDFARQNETARAKDDRQAEREHIQGQTNAQGRSRRRGRMPEP